MPCPAQVAPSAGPDLSPSLPDRYVLAVGSLIARKGYDVLVKAMGLVRDRGHNLNLVIVGAGPEAFRLTAFVLSSCCLVERVTCLRSRVLRQRRRRAPRD